MSHTFTRNLRSTHPDTIVGTLSGIGTVQSGVVPVSAGLWARREVRATLARERIVGPGDAQPGTRVARGTAARSLAELIRLSTLEAAQGRTYAETELYLDTGGNRTSDRERAQRDEHTGQPVENPQHALWLQSTTLQTALMQAYMGSRIAELTIGLGAILLVAGAGLTAAAGLRD